MFHRSTLLKNSLLAAFAVVAVSGCGAGSEEQGGASQNGLQASQSQSQSNQPSQSTEPVGLDVSCDSAQYPSPLFAQCEASNVSITYQANREQLSPEFIARSEAQQQANRVSLLERFLSDPSWNTPPAFGNSPATPLCAAGMGPCVGDPFRYPEVDGPDGKVFYTQEAQVVPVVYYDQGCARISGRVWRPLNSGQARLPVVVIKNGSVQANEQLYWWAAQALVRQGYLVLTSDPRGQGRSDAATPTGEQGGNFNGTVFFEGLVNDIDFVLSSPQKPYPHQANCANTYPTQTNSFNPLHTYVDANRIGAAGHSYGAGGVTWAQSYGGAGSLPWPGLMTKENPIKAIVAWDALGSIASPNSATLSSLFDSGRGATPSTPLTSPARAPAVVPRVPALGFSSEYGFTPVPFLRDPPRDAHLAAFKDWQTAGQPVMNLTIAGSTHLDYSPGPSLPASSWCPKIENNACVGGWAKPVIIHYTLAWFDRWLKVRGETSFADADQRLLDDAQWAERLSFHYASARDFKTRNGRREQMMDVRGRN